jgi:excisionase family DNA binding protein
MPDRLLTIREAAAFLAITPKTVRGYVRRGELHGFLLGGRWRFRQEDLDAFVNALPTQWSVAARRRGEE